MNCGLIYITTADGVKPSRQKIVFEKLLHFQGIQLAHDLKIQNEHICETITLQDLSDNGKAILQEKEKQYKEK